jgi:hypothetical protein
VAFWRSEQFVEVKNYKLLYVENVCCTSYLQNYISYLVLYAQVDIELKQFIKGYLDGSKGGDDHLLMLKLKEWPRPSVLEVFLLCQRPEFIVNFPLVDFIHPRWGLLNLAAKLPPDALQPELGMKLLIAHGSHQELGKGDSMTNLMINMCDVVSLVLLSFHFKVLVRFECLFFMKVG